MYITFAHYKLDQLKGYLDGLLQKGGVAFDLGRQAHVDVAISDNYHKTANDGGIHLGCEVQALSLLQESTQCSLNLFQGSSIQSLHILIPVRNSVVFLT